jgi:hypothetical protein
MPHLQRDRVENMHVNTCQDPQEGLLFLLTTLCCVTSFFSQTHNDVKGKAIHDLNRTVGHTCQVSHKELHKMIGMVAQLLVLLYEAPSRLLSSGQH